MEEMGDGWIFPAAEAGTQTYVFTEMKIMTYVRRSQQ